MRLYAGFTKKKYLDSQSRVACLLRWRLSQFCKSSCSQSDRANQIEPSGLLNPQGTVVTPTFAWRGQKRTSCERHLMSSVKQVNLESMHVDELSAEVHSIFMIGWNRARQESTRRLRRTGAVFHDFQYVRPTAIERRIDFRHIPGGLRTTREYKSAHYDHGNGDCRCRHRRRRPARHVYLATQSWLQTLCIEIWGTENLKMLRMQPQLGLADRVSVRCFVRRYRQ